MPKLPSVKGKDAIKAFKNLGFNEARIESSHHILKKEGFRYLLSIPVHGSKTIPSGTLRGLIRTAGISVDEFIIELNKK